MIGFPGLISWNSVHGTLYEAACTIAVPDGERSCFVAEEVQSLILETSGRIGQVGVGRNGILLSVRRLDEARRHARDLAPAVAELLAEQHWQPRDVNVVIVGK